jgi:hypothetical protein
MVEIDASRYERVIPLFDAIGCYRPAIFTVLEGRQAGRVFVDRVNDPTAAVVSFDFCYFGGGPAALDLQSEVVDLLEHELMPQYEHLLLVPLTGPWDDALKPLLQPYNPQRYERAAYVLDADRFHELNAGWQTRIADGFTVRRLDADTSLEVGGIPEMWGSVETFLSDGYGFCMIDEAQPDLRSGFASSAQTVFVGGGHAETGVATREAYRRRGLATTVSCAFIEHSLQNGIRPDWGCVNNEASEKLACRMGYGDKRSWPLLYIHTPQVLAKQTDAHSSGA